jgi:2-polyprenyl-3-methyl-5-hydroxy-6-metoxy-1,4-benzoquinol methylase
MKCKNCGLLFLYPLPNLTPQKLEQIYGEDYTETVYPDEQGKMDEDALNRQMEIVEKYVKVGRALNIGAMGSEVRVIKNRGWNLTIVDASKYALDRARKRGGVDELYLSKIEDFSCPPGSYDFIKFGHVIEHLKDPAEVLLKLSQMLRPGGIILVDTDNADGLETRIEESIMKFMRMKIIRKSAEKLVGKKYNLRYGRLTPPVHLYTFTSKSLIALTEKSGLKVLKSINSAWGDPTWFPTYNKSLVERMFIGIDQVGLKFGKGNVIAVLAQKI